MPHWTQTPAGRKRMAAIQRARPKGEMRRAMAKTLEIQRQKRLAAANGHAPVVGDKNTKRASARAMLNTYARIGMIARRADLVRELQAIDLFLANTDPKPKA